MSSKRASFVAAIIVIAAVFCAVSQRAVSQQPATVKLWNFNIHDKKYQQKMYKLFNERHPEIKIEYTSIANTMYDQVLEASFVASEPPDLFIPYGKLGFTYLRTKGWILPLNECVPNETELKNWINQFPPQLRITKFMEGSTVFGGKVYIVDLAGVHAGSSLGFPLFYNKTLFRDAGIERPPATQSELRQTAAKIAQAGAGWSFGLVHGMKNPPSTWWFDYGNSLAYAAGAKGLGISGGAVPDMRDGRFHNSSPESVAALQLWIDMRKDGSVYPGETTMDDEQAKMAFATDRAAMQFGGEWNISNYLAYNADADFDLVLPPTPDDGVRRGLRGIGVTPVGGAFGYAVSSFAKNPRAVWEVIKFVSSLEYQEGYVKGGYGISYLPEANKPENFQVRQMYKFVQWAADPSLSRMTPVLSDAAGKALEMRPGVYPTYFDVVDNVYLGHSPLDALKDIDKRADENLDEGIKKAQEAGIKVTRDDFVFPDWDPMKDYVPKKK